MSADASIATLVFMVMAFAIVDSVDPCVFVLFISMLTSSLLVSVKHAIKIGCSFIISMYMGYTLFGLLIRYALPSLPRGLLALIILLYATVVGLLALFTGKRKSEEFVCREDDVPCRIISKLRLHQVAFNTVTAGLIGFIASFTLLPCSAGLYFVYNIATARYGYTLWIPLTLLYVAIFVLPLILILLGFIGLSRVGSIYSRIVGLEKPLKILASLIMYIIALDLLLDLHLIFRLLPPIS